MEEQSEAAKLGYNVSFVLLNRRHNIFEKYKTGSRKDPFWCHYRSLTGFPHGCKFKHCQMMKHKQAVGLKELVPAQFHRESC